MNDLPGHTHTVSNQPKPLENYNAYRADKVLQQWVNRFGGQWGEQQLARFGHAIGHELIGAGFDANRVLPEFHSHDRFGHRIDLVNYHPGYHQLMQHAIEHGHCNLPWQTPQQGAHTVRAAMALLHTHADPGSGCPLTMTFASIPTLSIEPSIAKQWLPKVLANHYDPTNRPWFEKNGLTIGMAMTEKQGGSDVRANTTTAQPVAAHGPGETYRLTGHKWFCSAPMCDGFLVLAYIGDGLSCFLVPRWRRDGQKNSMFIQRLKSKLGNRSNASSEIEFHGAEGYLIGQPGRGIAAIIQMVALTRYDCMLGSSALMMQAAKEAIWHTAERNVFGKPLHEQPLMLNVLADLAIEAEAALAISLRLSKALDNANDPSEASLVRSATCVGKYWIAKRAVQHTYEAMECVGGVGYVDDSVLNRLYREAPVNAIWEGSGNVQCLDLLRVMQREPDSMQALLADIERGANLNPVLAGALQSLSEQLHNPALEPFAARQVMEQLALCWQSSTLIQHGDAMIAETFVDNRLSPSKFHQYGTLNANTDAKLIVERAMPKCEF